MRGIVWAIVLVGLFPACTEDNKMESANVLELQIGGENESLSVALQRPPPGAKKIAPTRPKPDGPGPGGTKPDDSKSIPPKSIPPKSIPPKPKVEFHVVTLGEGGTLYDLCRTHLGSPARWKEVAAFNGWSEERAGKLPTGQKVKLPVR
jgi:hypothetical protein